MLADGMAHAPLRAGHGVSFDRSGLNKLSV